VPVEFRPPVQTKGFSMKLPLVVLLSTMASVTHAAGVDSAAWDQFNTRMHEMFDTTGWEFRQAVDTRQITKDLQSNQARAQIKFSKPGVYHGRISNIMMDDQGAFFIIDQGKNTAVTVFMSGYQAWPWNFSGGKPEITGIQSLNEFAANFDTGQELYFQCRRVEFGLGIYLRNCLVFPPSVATSRSAPKLINEVDMGARFDELIKARSAEGWTRPPSARKGMVVELEIGIKPDGTLRSVRIAKSSGDEPFDTSAVAAVKNIGRLAEMQGMKPEDIARYRLFRMLFTPEDLSL
jgi:colicin import membrane protein